MSDRALLRCRYHMAPFSVDERKSPAPSRREHELSKVTREALEPATFTELLQKIDPRTGQVVEENPSFLKQGDSAIVKMRPLGPIVMEEYSDIPQLGRFAVRDMGMTIAVGVVKEITEKA